MEIEKIHVDLDDRTKVQAEINRRATERAKKESFEKERKQKLKLIENMLAQGKRYNPDDEDEKADLVKYGIYKEVVNMVRDATIKAQFALELDKKINIDDEDFISDTGFGIMQWD